MVNKSFWALGPIAFWVVFADKKTSVSLFRVCVCVSKKTQFCYISSLEINSDMFTMTRLFFDKRAKNILIMEKLEGTLKRVVCAIVVNSNAACFSSTPNECRGIIIVIIYCCRLRVITFCFCVVSLASFGEIMRHQ